jgi:hypothetical protein
VKDNNAGAGFGGLQAPTGSRRMPGGGGGATAASARRPGPRSRPPLRTQAFSAALLRGLDGAHHALTACRPPPTPPPRPPKHACPPPPVGDTDRIRLHTVEYESELSSGAACGNGVVAGIDEDTCLALPEWAIRSGPRKTVYFDPEKARPAADWWGGFGQAGGQLFRPGPP